MLNQERREEIFYLHPYIIDSDDSCRNLEIIELNYHIFLDFDGTVTTIDVGYTFFKVFAEGKAEEVVRQYRQGEISAVDCLQGECDIYNEYPAPAAQVKEFINSQQITAGFKEFIEFCRKRTIQITIISAGFDFYIKPILDKIGLADIEYLANATTLKNGRIYPEFTYYDKAACERCSNCKGIRIKELKKPDDISVFIGDGHSDFHGARAADIVFAKSFLADDLKEAGIDFIPYDNFFDIINELGKLVANNG
jgi:2-hydroxy-3-keto-5-methylthiopentenyl-1-phosphate phosphatase